MAQEPRVANANANIQEQSDTLEATGTTVTPQEMEVSFAHPAPICNRVLLTMAQLGGRLSFLEIAPNGQPYFRGAVFMTTDALLSLQDLIGGMVPQNTTETVPEENKNVRQG